VNELFGPEDAEIEAELARRKRASFGAGSVCGRSPHQMRMVRSRVRRAVVRAARRSGKTVGFAGKMILRSMEEPVAPVGYGTLTRENAKRIIWPDLIRLNEEWHLGAKLDLSALTMTIPGGGVISIHGVDKVTEIAKLRGHKFGMFVLDECQSIRNALLVELLEEILDPTLRDYRGILNLGGTVPPVQSGRWWDIGWGKLAPNWEQHFWTLKDNPYFPAYSLGQTYEDVIAEILKDNAWDPTNKTFMREYLGIAVEDLDALLFAYAPELNDLTTDVPDDMSHVIGVDLGGIEGGDDSDGIEVIGWQRHDRTVYQCHWETGHGDIEDIANRIKPLMARFKPISIVIDQGGLGKKIAESLRQRYGIPVKAAEKSRKSEYIKLLNTDLRAGRVKAKADSQVVHDWKNVEKDPEAWKIGQLKERKGGYHGDNSDAFLYAWREALHWLEQPAVPVKPLQNLLRDARMERIEKEKREQPDEYEEMAELMGYRG